MRQAIKYILYKSVLTKNINFKMFVGFMPEESPESSFKGETTFMFFVWKEFFTSAEFKTTSEETRWCERSFVLPV